MRVLIAYEESQEICKAFRALGHEAYSCDIEDCSGKTLRYSDPQTAKLRSKTYLGITKAIADQWSNIC